MSTFASLKLNRLYNLKLPVFKFLGERTNDSDNEQIYHPNFVSYVERSSSGDINPTSCHLSAFELINQQLYINFPSLERKIFPKDLKSTLPSSVALWFRNLGTVCLGTLVLAYVQKAPRLLQVHTYYHQLSNWNGFAVGFCLDVRR